MTSAGDVTRSTEATADGRLSRTSGRPIGRWQHGSDDRPSSGPSADPRAILPIRLHMSLSRVSRNILRRVA